MDWIQIVNTVGFPITLCGALLYGFYRCGIFLGPLVKDFVAAQMDLIQSLKETTSKQTGILETHSATLNDHGHKLEEIHRKVVGHE